MASFRPVALFSLVLLATATVVLFDQQSKAEFDAISPVYTGTTPNSASMTSRPAA